MFLELGEDRKVWITKAKQLKAGTASIQTKARYVHNLFLSGWVLTARVATVI